VFLGGFAYLIGALYARRVRSMPTRRASSRDLLPISLGVALGGVAAFVIGAGFPR
jgi:hypothetical protein